MASENLNSFISLYKEKAQVALDRAAKTLEKRQGQLESFNTLRPLLKEEAKTLGFLEDFERLFPENGEGPLFSQADMMTYSSMLESVDDSKQLKALYKIDSAPKRLKTAEEYLKTAEEDLARDPEEYLGKLHSALIGELAKTSSLGGKSIDILKQKIFEDQDSYGDIIESISENVDGPRGVKTNPATYAALKELVDSGISVKPAEPVKEDDSPINEGEGDSTEADIDNSEGASINPESVDKTSVPTAESDVSANDPTLTEEDDVPIKSKNAEPTEDSEVAPSSSINDTSIVNEGDESTTNVTTNISNESTSINDNSSQVSKEEKSETSNSVSDVYGINSSPDVEAIDNDDTTSNIKTEENVAVNDIDPKINENTQKNPGDLTEEDLDNLQTSSAEVINQSIEGDINESSASEEVNISNSKNSIVSDGSSINESNSVNNVNNSNTKTSKSSEYNTMFSSDEMDLINQFSPFRNKEKPSSTEENTGPSVEVSKGETSMVKEDKPQIAPIESQTGSSPEDVYLTGGSSNTSDNVVNNKNTESSDNSASSTENNESMSSYQSNKSSGETDVSSLEKRLKKIENLLMSPLEVKIVE